MNFSRVLTKNIKKYLGSYLKHNESTSQNTDLQLIIYPRRYQNELIPKFRAEFSDFQEVENILEHFESPDVQSLLNDPTKVFLFKLHLAKISSYPMPGTLKELSKKCENISIVLLLASKKFNKFYLYWKSKEIKHFMTFRDDDFVNYRSIFEFVANFLATSLQRGHLGLLSQIPIHPEINTFDLNLLADSRDYNLLLVAAEQGDLNIVKFMLDRSFSTESRGTNAQNLAWNGRHFEILFLLLRSNLTYPAPMSDESQSIKFNIDECPVDIKEFYGVSQRLNEAMRAKNEAKVLEILSENPEMLYFYNLDNDSAMAFALKNKLLDMYQMLISKDFQLGPHENFGELKKGMTKNDLIKLGDIHYKESKFQPDNHMHILTVNSRLAPGTSEPKQKYEIIQEAFEILNRNPFIQVILMIVAASRNFRILFDFSCDSVEVIDPPSDQRTKGSFYLTGRIYIGAKQLLNPLTRFETLGTLAHELCHCAMNSVYKNFANPYTIDDSETERRFDEISKICKEKCIGEGDTEEIVCCVFRNYPSSVQHAELIVRAPHLMMQYSNLPEIFKKVRGNFSKLFEIFEGKIVPEMRRALPNIESKADVAIEKRDRKIRKLQIVSFFAILLSIIVVIVGIVKTRPSNEVHKYVDLSDKDQKIIKDAFVIYKNVNLKFSELFSENSTAYDLLLPDHISQMLRGEILDLSHSKYEYLNKIPNYKWKDLPEKLQKKVLGSNLRFQNENINFEAVKEMNGTLLHHLTSKQIIDVLDGHTMHIHETTKDEKFYVDRMFINENIYEIYFAYMEENSVKNLKAIPKCYFVKSGNLSFENFYVKFTHEYLENEIYKTQQKISIMGCSISDFKMHSSTNSEIVDFLLNYTSFILNSDKIVDNIDQEKAFILSADEGTGKTTIFKHLKRKIKQKYLNRWVTYIDLKDHTELFENFEISTNSFNGVNVEGWIDVGGNLTKVGYDSEIKIAGGIRSDIIKSDKFENTTDKGNKTIVENGTEFTVRPETKNEIFNQFEAGIEIETESKMSFEMMVPKDNENLSKSSRIPREVHENTRTIFNLPNQDVHIKNSNLLNIKNLLKKIFKISSKNQFEMKFFEHIFNNENIVLIWNGFDEIYPQYGRIVLEILEFIKQNTNIVQFISTRPLYSRQLSYKLGVNSYTLVPFDKSKQDEFLFKFFRSKNIDENLVSNYTDKFWKTVDPMWSETDFNNPLMLTMFGNLISIDDDKIENIYEIFEQIVTSLGQSWEEKNDFGKKFVKSLLLKNSRFNMIKLYQKHAIAELIYSDLLQSGYFDSRRLKIMRIKKPEELTSDQISRMGILNIIGPKHFQFAHRIFADFFVAKYLIENIFNADDEPNETEATLRLNILYDVVQSNLKNVKSFITFYLKTENCSKNQKFDRMIGKVLKKKFEKFLFNNLKQSQDDFLQFFLDFFSKDREILLRLLQIDENETFYTAVYNPAYAAGKIDKKLLILRNFVKNYLNAEEHQKFISGKNQKGVIMFGLYCSYQYSGYRNQRMLTHETYSISDELLKNEDSIYVFESIAKKLTKNELRELLTQKMSPIFFERAGIYSSTKFWAFIETTLAINEQKEFLLNALSSITILSGQNSADFFFQKAAEKLSSLEIFHTFSSQNILHLAAAYDSITFKKLWDFFSSHTNFDQQKEILKRKANSDCHIEPGFPTQAHFCYIFPAFNILQSSLLTKLSFDDYDLLKQFHRVKTIYENYLNKSEIKGLIFNSSTFLPFLISYQEQNVCEEFAKYLRNYFKGDEKLLKIFLTKKVALTDVDTFHLLDDHIIVQNRENRLKIFLDLLKFTEDI